MGNFDKKFIKQRRKEEKKALKQQYRKMKKQGIKVTPEFKKDAEKAVRKYSVKQELARRKRIFTRMGGKEENFNEKDARREILQDFRAVENSKIRVRVAAFLAAAGLTLGIGPKLLSEATNDARVEENGYQAGEIDEEEAKITSESPSEGEITIEVDPENPWIKEMDEESKISESPAVEQSFNVPDISETVNIDNIEERNISEEVYFKLKESSTDEIKEYCKNIYASVYEEKTGEEIDIKTLEIKQEHKGYSFKVTLPDGQNVIILHEGDPVGIKKQLNSLTGVTYEKAVYGHNPYYIIYQETSKGSKLIDGSIDGKAITTIDNLKSVLKNGEQGINRSASMIPDYIWNIMVLAMTGDKNLSNDELIQLSRWIRDNGLEESVLEEQSEVEGHTDVEAETLVMTDEAIELSKEPSERETFLGQLREWKNQSNATTSRESTNEKTLQQNINQQNLEDNGR